MKLLRCFLFAVAASTAAVSTVLGCFYLCHRFDKWVQSLTDFQQMGVGALIGGGIGVVILTVVLFGALYEFWD